MSAQGRGNRALMYSQDALDGKVRRARGGPGERTRRNAQGPDANIGIGPLCVIKN